MPKKRCLNSKKPSAKKLLTGPDACTRSFPMEMNFERAADLTNCLPEDPTYTSPLMSILGNDLYHASEQQWEDIQRVVFDDSIKELEQLQFRPSMFHAFRKKAVKTCVMLTPCSTFESTPMPSHLRGEAVVWKMVTKVRHFYNGRQVAAKYQRPLEIPFIETEENSNLGEGLARSPDWKQHIPKTHNVQKNLVALYQACHGRICDHILREMKMVVPLSHPDLLLGLVHVPEESITMAMVYELFNHISTSIYGQCTLTKTCLQDIGLRRIQDSDTLDIFYTFHLPFADVILRFAAFFESLIHKFTVPVERLVVRNSDYNLSHHQVEQENMSSEFNIKVFLMFLGDGQ